MNIKDVDLFRPEMATFEDGRVIKDEDVFDIVKQNTNFIDRLNYKKMITAGLKAFAILAENGHDSRKK